MKSGSRKRSLRACFAPLFLGSSLTLGCGTSSTVNNEEPLDAGTDAPMCPDTCAPQPADWNGPALVRSSAAMNAPSCPADAPQLVYQGNADLVASPHECAACTCEASTGICGMITTITFYLSDVACVPSQTIFPYDPPPNWDGSCVADNPIPKDSVNTVKIGKHPLTDDHCSPTSPIPEINAPAPLWNTHAWACSAEGSPECNGKTCIQQNRAGDGFVSCVYREGITECPPDYPFHHVFYDGFDDQRACSTCECGPPVGSDCAGHVQFYEDGACQKMAMSLTSGASGNGGACLLGPNPEQFQWWVPFGSKTAGPIEYWPGTCAASGGEPIGEVTSTGQTTFCCQYSL